MLCSICIYAWFRGVDRFKGLDPEQTWWKWNTESRFFRYGAGGIALPTPKHSYINNCKKNKTKTKLLPALWHHWLNSAAHQHPKIIRVTLTLARKQLWDDLPGRNCWAGRWEGGPDCGTAVRIPSLTRGNSTSKSPCEARMDADDFQIRWLKLLNSLQSGASCVFLLHLCLSVLMAFREIITL